MISVIIPVYNTAQYLPRCLDSIIANDYQKLEIICINDGSSDNSLSIIKEYEEKDNRIVVIDSPHVGVSKARNIGLDKASGEFICFIDSDDWIHNRFFSLLFECVKKTDADMTVCMFLRTDAICLEDDISKGSSKMIVYDNSGGINNHTVKSYVWGRLYSSKLISSHRFEEGLQTAEDTLFNLELFADNEKLRTVLLKDVMYYYYNRSGSIINTTSSINFLKFSYIYLERAELATNKHKARVYLNDAFKNTFAIRYNIRIFANDELKDEINRLINRCLIIEKDKNLFGFRKSTLYRLLARFPSIYTCFRNLKER